MLTILQNWYLINSHLINISQNITPFSSRDSQTMLLGSDKLLIPCTYAIKRIAKLQTMPCHDDDVVVL